METQTQLLTVKQAADQLGIHEKSCWKWVAQGKLNVVRLAARCTRIKLADVEALIAEAVAADRPARVSPSTFAKLKAQAKNQ